MSAFRIEPLGSAKIYFIQVSLLGRRVFSLVLAVVVLVIPGWAQSTVLNEYEAKAGFLFNFVKFVEWPTNSFASSDSPIIIGVIGDDSDSAIIERTINGKIANGRQLVIRRFATTKTLTLCHVLFIKASVRNHIQTLAASGPGVLTVGETERFARSGGIINLIIINGKLRLEINRTSAERAGLKISAKLLSLARVIRN